MFGDVKVDFDDEAVISSDEAADAVPFEEGTSTSMRPTAYEDRR